MRKFDGPSIDEPPSGRVQFRLAKPPIGNPDMTSPTAGPDASVPETETEVSGYVGRPLRRVEDARLLTGNGGYTADLDLPGQAHAVFVRSPHAHALITAIDGDAARAADGVLGVICGADLEAADIGPIPSLNGTPPYQVLNADGSALPDASQPALAVGRVRFVGEPVAMIVAETRAQATDAADLLEITYEPLPAVASIETALQADAPKLWPDLADNRTLDWQSGDAADTEDRLGQAAHLVELEVAFPRAMAVFMEPRGAIASFDADSGRYTLHAGCQSSHRQRGLLSKILGIPEDQVRVIVPDTGGGFGARGTVYPEFVALLHGTRSLGRPVKWIAERSESFLTDTQARSQKIVGRLALDADGQFLALQVAATWCHGAYFATRAAFVLVGAMPPMICGTYHIPACHFSLQGVCANLPPIAAYRAVARAEANYLLERLIDHAAERSGFDPVALRRRNLIAQDEMPWTTAAGATYQPARFEHALDQGLAAIDHSGFPARRAGSSERGRLRGLGLALFVISAGGEPDESAEIRVNGDGSVRLLVGTQDFGMGHATVFGQVVADRLGLSPDQVTVLDGDSDLIPLGRGAHGSRSMRIGGGAIVKSVETVIERGRAIAAEMMEAASSDIAFEAGDYVIQGTDRRVGLIQTAAEAERLGAPLGAHETFQTQAPAYPSGCHLCEVEIDPETGRVSLERVVSVIDPGRVINPLIVEGQVHGGLAQGLGEALVERVVYDPASGQLLSGSFMDFALPRADDLPNFVSQLDPVDCPDNPLGVKGVGEAGTAGAPAALVNAVLDALRPAGVDKIDMPLTPERVWQALAGRPEAA